MNGDACRGSAPPDPHSSFAAATDIDTRLLSFKEGGHRQSLLPGRSHGQHHGLRRGDCQLPPRRPRLSCHRGCPRQPGHSGTRFSMAVLLSWLPQHPLPQLNICTPVPNAGPAPGAAVGADEHSPLLRRPYCGQRPRPPPAPLPPLLFSRITRQCVFPHTCCPHAR